MAHRPSGLPGSKAGPTIRRGEIDFDGQVRELHRAVVGLRRGLLVVLAILVALLLVFVVTGRGGGVWLTGDFAVGVVIVLLANEPLVRWSRRRVEER